MVAGAAFAADASASVYMTGTLAAGSDGGNTTIMTLNDQNQKDADAIEFSYAGEQAGAAFKFWYTYNGLGNLTVKDEADDSDFSQALRVRSVSLWFKPFEILKVSVGDIGQYLYTEQLHWWKTPTGIGAVAASGWNHRWSNYSGLEKKGVNFSLTPIEGLSIDAALQTDDSWGTIADGELTNMGYGATVKYSMGNMSFGLGWRDEGKGFAKILSVGADFNASGLYGFVQPRFYFGSNKYTETGWYVDNVDGLTGVAIDNYIKYSAGALSIAGRFPFTVRLTELDNDPSY